MSKVEFKEFVKRNPNLISFVEKGETNWQKLYELYDLYGDDNSVWDKYLKKSNTSNSMSFGNVSSNFKELINFIRGVDLNTVQKGLSSLDKAIDAFKEIIPSKEESLKNNYEPRPTYKYFED